MAIGTARLLGPILPRAWRGIEAETVARALLAAVREARPGVRIIGNAEIARLGG